MIQLDERLDHAPCGFLSLADDGEILDVNATLLDSLGYLLSELKGRRIESILPVASRIFYQTHFFPLIKLHGKVNEVYLTLRAKDESELPVLVNAVRRVHDQVAITDCVLMQMRNRNEYEDQILKAKRMAEEATLAKDQFLAVVSHELRTPLTAILGWSRLLKMGKLDASNTAQALETIERNAHSQSQLIEDLLDFSRIISGKIRLDVGSVDPAAVTEAAINVVRPAVDAKGIKLQVILDPRTGPVSGDPERLQQVLWNLLSNAVKFTPKGGHIQVRLARVNSNVEITVSDTGEGISAEFLPYVFERFSQADNTTTRMHRGLGLGMAITKHIVELHGGTIHVISPGVGQGSSFILKLPIRVVHDTTRAKTTNPLEPPAENQPVQPPPLNGVRLLVVDDEQDTLALLMTILTDSG
ncbi:MAG TPA: PAS domain-containing sensor histidine kinase, partial [Pyrinomonadaceae bacterium]|nr:PAS domain-containing sensor histidine kinase [Pyrinomonadaceae bacterium]